MMGTGFALAVTYSGRGLSAFVVFFWKVCESVKSMEGSWRFSNVYVIAFGLQSL